MSSVWSTGNGDSTWWQQMVTGLRFPVCLHVHTHVVWKHIHVCARVFVIRLPPGSGPVVHRLENLLRPIFRLHPQRFWVRLRVIALMLLNCRWHLMSRVLCAGLCAAAPPFIALCVTALHRCVFWKLKARPSTLRKITTHPLYGRDRIYCGLESN